MKKNLVVLLIAIVAMCSCGVKLPQSTTAIPSTINTTTSIDVTSIPATSTATVDTRERLVLDFSTTKSNGYEYDTHPTELIEEFFHKSELGKSAILNVSGYKNFADSNLLKLGSSSVEGYFDVYLNPNYSVSSMEISAQSYCKYVDYGSYWNSDNSKVVIQDIENSNIIFEQKLKHNDAAENPIDNIKIDFENSLPSFRFFAADGRIFMHSITLIF